MDKLLAKVSYKNTEKSLCEFRIKSMLCNISTHIFFIGLVVICFIIGTFFESKGWLRFFEVITILYLLGEILLPIISSKIDVKLGKIDTTSKIDVDFLDKGIVVSVTNNKKIIAQRKAPYNKLKLVKSGKYCYIYFSEKEVYLCPIDKVDPKVFSKIDSLKSKD